MEKLTYQMGQVEIDPKRLVSTEQEDGWKLQQKEGRGLARHLFVVSYMPNPDSNSVNMSLTWQAARHSHVAGRFNISDDVIVGGGGCFVDHLGVLIIAGFSGDYGAIPKTAADSFAELLSPEIIKLGVNIKEIFTNPTEKELKDFWKNHGFVS